MHHQVLLQEQAKGEKRHRKSALVLQMRKNGNGNGLHPQDLGQDLDPGVDQVRDVEAPHVVDVGHGVEVVVKFDHHEKIAEVKVDLHEKIGKVLLRDDGDRDHQNREDRDHQNRADRDHQDKGKDPQCGNFMIFLSLRFYVKSIFGILDVEVQNMYAFLHLD